MFPLCMTKSASSMFDILRTFHGTVFKYNRHFGKDSQNVITSENLATKHFVMKTEKKNRKDIREILLTGIRAAAKHNGCDPNSRPCNKLELMGQAVTVKHTTKSSHR